MKSEELTPLDLGGSERSHWYELFPERFAEEVELMSSVFPSFVLGHNAGKDVTWTGRVAFYREDRTELYALDIRIECPREYPIVFPRVIDEKGVLAEKGCPHIYADNKKVLCYGNRLDPSLDFSGKTRIKDLVEYIAVFLGRQWHFEQYGYWPHGQPHGMDAFLEHELNVGRIDPLGLCPCGLNGKTYGECHLKALANQLLQQERLLKPEFRNKLKRPGRNDPCPCGQKKVDGIPLKFKKCCERKVNFPTSMLFLLMNANPVRQSPLVSAEKPAQNTFSSDTPSNTRDNERSVPRENAAMSFPVPCEVSIRKRHVQPPREV